MNDGNARSPTSERFQKLRVNIKCHACIQFAFKGVFDSHIWSTTTLQNSIFFLFIYLERISNQILIGKTVAIELDLALHSFITVLQAFIVTP